MTYELVSIGEANRLLARDHYLGPIRRGFAFGQRESDRLVAVQVWSKPVSKYLPQDGTWLELRRWCLTKAAGPNAGSRLHAVFVRWCRVRFPRVTTLVSYSDPSEGHTGALYRACNWYPAPTWLRLRPPPTGNGSWNGERQEVKDRWVFDVAPDDRRPEILRVKDDALVR